MDASEVILLPWVTEPNRCFYRFALVIVLTGMLHLFVVNLLTTKSRQNKVKHAFVPASHEATQHRAFRDAGSDLRYGFRPLPLYAYVARHDGGRIVFI